MGVVEVVVITGITVIITVIMGAMELVGLMSRRCLGERETGTGPVYLDCQVCPIHSYALIHVLYTHIYSFTSNTLVYTHTLLCVIYTPMCDIRSYTHTLIHSYTHILIHSYTHTLIHSYATYRCSAKCLQNTLQ